MRERFFRRGKISFNAVLVIVILFGMGAAAFDATSVMAADDAPQPQGVAGQTCSFGYDYIVRPRVPIEAVRWGRCFTWSGTPSGYFAGGYYNLDKRVPQEAKSRWCYGEDHPQAWQCMIWSCGNETDHPEKSPSENCTAIQKLAPIGGGVGGNAGGTVIAPAPAAPGAGVPADPPFPASPSAPGSDVPLAGSQDILGGFVNPTLNEICTQTSNSGAGCQGEGQGAGQSNDQVMTVEGWCMYAGGRWVNGGCDTSSPTNDTSSGRGAGGAPVNRGLGTEIGNLRLNETQRRVIESACAGGTAGGASERCRQVIAEQLAEYRGPGSTFAGAERECILRGGAIVNGQCITINPNTGLGSLPPGCLLSTNPNIIDSRRPECLNAVLGQQQQCQGLQQILGTCRNPLTGQQQCSGILLMLNKCPTGSYNPNNPSNPYNYPAPTCTIQVSPAHVSAAGQAATLQWQSQNAQYASLSNTGQIGPSGSMTVYPQAPTTYTMTVIGYGNQQGQCQTQVAVGGQGVPGAGGPQAQISCQPQTADVGMQVGISFACQNSAVSAGSGFSTGGALSGSATTTVSAPLGQNTTTYGLTCSNQGVIHTAQCTVNVNKAAIVLTAVPKKVSSGGKAVVGWVTSGMDLCTVSTSGSGTSYVGATSTPTAGSIDTGPLTETTDFGLTCTTKSGMTKAATTTVQVGN